MKFYSYDSSRGRACSGWNVGVVVCDGRQHIVANCPDGVFTNPPSVYTESCPGEGECPKPGYAPISRQAAVRWLRRFSAFQQLADQLEAES